MPYHIIFLPTMHTDAYNSIMESICKLVRYRRNKFINYSKVPYHMYVHLYCLIFSIFHCMNKITHRTFRSVFVRYCTLPYFLTIMDFEHVQVRSRNSTITAVVIIFFVHNNWYSSTYHKNDFGITCIIDLLQ